MGGEVVGTGLVIFRHCADCKRPERLKVPLMDLPDGTALCEVCLRRRQSVAQRLHGRTAPMSVPLMGPMVVRPPAPKGSYYELLEIPFDASATEISDALKAKMKYWLERQAGADRQLAEDMLNRLRKASVELRDADRRQAYDAQLREQAKQARLDVVTSSVRPLEDFPGKQVASLLDLVRVCEGTPRDWRIGEGLLRNKALLYWARFALGDAETVQLIEQVSALAALSDTRKLNRLLYQLDPDRPFRFYSNPGTAEPARNEYSASTIPELVTFADANWDLAVAHLYNGELLTWLDLHVGTTAYEGRHYQSARAFFDAQCRQFADSRHAGLGLELLLEFISSFLPKPLEKPAITVTFDQQADGYTLLNWDGELEHQAVTLTITNTTRGYYAGEVKLEAPAARYATPYPWVAFHSLPLATTPRPQDLSSPPGHKDDAGGGLTLKGKASATYRVHLGNFGNLRRGKRYQRNVILSRYESSPTEAVQVGAYPITLRLMRFLGGYRAKLWQFGLRGSLPGALLDGGIAALIALMVCVIGFHVVPGDYWGFLPPTQEYIRQFNWAIVIDGALTGLLRPFYLAIATFGWALIAYIGVAFGVCGFFTGRGRGHTKLSDKRDLRIHRVFTRWLVLALLVWTGVIVALTYAALNPPFQQPPSLTLPGQTDPTYLLMYSLTHANVYPPEWSGFLYAAAVAPPVFAYIAGRIIVRVRAILYRRVSARWGGLLTPPGKG